MPLRTTLGSNDLKSQDLKKKQQQRRWWLPPQKALPTNTGRTLTHSDPNRQYVRGAVRVSYRD